MTMGCHRVVLQPAPQEAGTGCSARRRFAGTGTARSCNQLMYSCNQQSAMLQPTEGGAGERSTTTVSQRQQRRAILGVASCWNQRLAELHPVGVVLERWRDEEGVR